METVPECLRLTRFDRRHHGLYILARTAPMFHCRTTNVGYPHVQHLKIGAIAIPAEGHDRAWVASGLSIYM
ncbi:MAG: hypothetical protein GY926_00260 [bacterium]|nr:hypothetical protein [bacterium]